MVPMLLFTYDDRNDINTWGPYLCFLLNLFPWINSGIKIPEDLHKPTHRLAKVPDGHEIHLAQSVPTNPDSRPKRVWLDWIFNPY